MTRRRLLCPVAAGLAGAALLLAAPALIQGSPDGCQPAPEPQAADASRQPCCYTHPQYTGVCVVQPAEDETCASILAYLNNPQSQGKSYCGNTNIRGSWKQTECAKKYSTPLPQGTPPL